MCFRSLAAAAAVLVVACTSGPARAAQSNYTITDLGTLGGTASQAYGINASGQVTGWARIDDGSTHAFRYSGGVMQDLGTLDAGYTQSAGWSINASGIVAGASGDPIPQIDPHQAKVTNGTTTTSLGTLGGADGVARAINNNGWVAGYARLAPDEVAFPDHPRGVSRGFVYDGTTMHPIPTFGGAESLAWGINSAGQAAGYAYLPDGTYNAFRYTVNGPDGGMENLGDFAALAIDDAGRVGGYYFDDAGRFHGVVHTAAALTEVGDFGGGFSIVSALNNAGDAVGGALEDADGKFHAFLYAAGTLTDLHDLLPPAASGWTLTRATGINDAGQIVGYGTNPDGLTRAFLLTPVPEPATLSLLAAAGGMLLTRRRKGS